MSTHHSFWSQYRIEYRYFHRLGRLCTHLTMVAPTQDDATSVFSIFVSASFFLTTALLSNWFLTKKRHIHLCENCRRKKLEREANHQSKNVTLPEENEGASDWYNLRRIEDRLSFDNLEAESDEDDLNFNEKIDSKKRRNNHEQIRTRHREPTAEPSNLEPDATDEFPINSNWNHFDLFTEETVESDPERNCRTFSRENSFSGDDFEQFFVWTGEDSVRQQKRKARPRKDSTGSGNEKEALQTISPLPSIQSLNKHSDQSTSKKEVCKTPSSVSSAFHRGVSLDDTAVWNSRRRPPDSDRRKIISPSILSPNTQNVSLASSTPTIPFSPPSHATSVPLNAAVKLLRCNSTTASPSSTRRLRRRTVSNPDMLQISERNGQIGEKQKHAPFLSEEDRTLSAMVKRQNRAARAQYNARIMPNKVVLVRHGQSMGNIDEKLYSTTPDNAMPLTRLGFEQARVCGKNLKARILGENETVHFIVSPYVRTVETFHGIVSAWCDPAEFAHIRDRDLRLKAWYSRLLELGLTWHEDPRIREQDFGNYQDHEKIKEAKKERVRFGTFYYRFAHGESASDVYDRISTFLDSLWRSFDMNKSQNYVLVTHGISIRVLLARYFRYTIDQFNLLRNPRNCEMVALSHDGRGKLRLLGRYELELAQDEDTGEQRVIGCKFHKKLAILPADNIRRVNIRISYDE